jgi:hypothetical protein
VPQLLGHYENFPEVVHGIGRLIYSSSKVNVQQAILRTLHRLNKTVFSLKDIVTFALLECEVKFELGMADGVDFYYLDGEELRRFQKGIVESTLPNLDFFCVVCYHIIKNGKRVPLKFDDYMLRFVFLNENSLELRVFHQRGVRRVSVEDFVTFVTKRINEELSQN